MKAVRKGLAVLLAVLLVLPGSPMSVERILVAEAAEADKEQETAIGAEMTGPEAGETVDGDELTDEDLAGGAVDAEDGATSLGTTEDENSDAQMESPSSDSADGGSDESEKETGDVTDSALDDEVTEKPSVAEDEEGSPEMPDDALEDLEEMPVDGSEEEDKSEDGNEVQSDGDTVQTDGSSSEEDGLDTETESGQPLVEDLPVVYAENIVASGADGNLTWTLDSDGLLTVSGTGDYSTDLYGIPTNLWGDYTDSITSAKVEVTGMTSTGNMFRECSHLTSVDLSGLDTSNVTSMGGMFYGCSGLTSLDLSGFDTSNVTYMASMFNGCSGLTILDLSGFDTSNVTDVMSMFNGCSGLTSLDVGGLDTSNVIATSNMFEGCSGLKSLDLSGFDTSNVTDMESMFWDCENLASLDLSGFDTSNVSDMRYMFSGCSALTSLDLSGFNTSNVVDMNGMFNGCSMLENLKLDNFNTGNVREMGGIFARCESLSNLDLGSFDTSNVVDMGSMFFDCGDLSSLNLKSFNTSNVVDMSAMFYGCSNLTSLNLSSFDTSNVANMPHMFAKCKSLSVLELGNFDTSNVSDMSEMFCGCSNLTHLDISKLDTSNVFDMEFMFYGCSSLINLDLSTFKTNNVRRMYAMFYGCSNLTSLNLSSFDTSNVVDMTAMFCGCNSLTTLDLSSFNVEKVTRMPYMLSDCNNLVKLNTPYYVTQSVRLLPEENTVFSIELTDGGGGYAEVWSSRPKPLVLNAIWRLADGTEVTELPQNLSYSVLINRYDVIDEPTDDNTTGVLYFHVTGAVGHSQYSDIYIAENTSQNILDTLFDPLYENHYQTLFINDSNTDLASLIPTFEVSANMEVLSPGGRLTSGQTVQDFSKGSIIYRLASSAKSSAMPGPATSPKTDWGYTVTFVKKESGPKLFVNGPAEREIFLTDYFQNQHDILIANLGDTQLTGIHAELLDAVNVKLDDSHPVESALAAFDRVPGQGQEASDVMANLGKVRLVPDGEGEISGTLKITADGQEPVYIVLTGYSSNPRITTTSTELNMDDVIRVKYVPYSYTVETNNEYEWNKVTFAVVEGELARGLEMYPATGEIYGVPLEAGEFSITVKATFSRPEFLPSYAQLTLIVKDNTDGNVSLATDPGYDLVQRVQDIALDTWAGGSQTMVSLGDYAEFRAVYLDGERLVEGEDYDSEAGSTRITVQNQTLADKGAGSHTLGIEFRTSDKEDLRRAAQNYTVAQAGNQTGNGGSGNGGSNFGGGFSSGTDDLYMIDAEVSEAIIYTVQPGDSLWSIAFRFYGTGAFWRRIYEDNMTVIQNPNRIYPGQKLVIRLADSDRAGDALTGAKGRIYTVMMGENLWTIAKKVYGNGMLWERIYQANRELIFDPRRIYAGQRIVIPVVE